MNPDELQAGRDLDALVATHVFDYRTRSAKLTNPHLPDDWFQREPDGGETFVPPYSTDIKAAWDVVERLASCQPRLARYVSPDKWWVRMNACGSLATQVEGWADTAPLAICRAALRAVGS